MSGRIELPDEIQQSVGTCEAAIAHGGRIKADAADSFGEVFEALARSAALGNDVVHTKS
jgi:hypothetical protein